MRRLLPEAGEVALDDLYLDLDIPVGSGRPHVYLGMVSSVDGAATIDGTSGALGRDADRVAFRRLRETCDAILVGAGTVRAEGYGRPAPDEGARARRVTRGLAETPRLVVVTGSLDLDPEGPLFTGAGPRPLLATTTTADHPALDRFVAAADLIRAGEDHVDLVEMLRQLAALGVGRLLCEGGPGLNAQLLAAGLVDELFLTVAPVLVGQPTPGVVRATPGATPRELQLRGLHEHDGELLLRYGVT